MSLNLQTIRTFFSQLDRHKDSVINRQDNLGENINQALGLNNDSSIQLDNINESNYEYYAELYNKIVNSAGAGDYLRTLGIDINMTKTKFTAEELKEEGFNAHYLLEFYFEKTTDSDGNETYKLKQPLTVSGKNIKSLDELRDILNLKTFDEYLESECTSESGSLWSYLNCWISSSGRLGKQGDNNDLACPTDSWASDFYKNLANELSQSNWSNWGNGGVERTMTGMPCYTVLGKSCYIKLDRQALAVALVNGGYIEGGKSHKSYTMAELDNAVMAFLNDFGTSLGKTIEELSVYDLAKYYCETQSGVKKYLENEHYKYTMNSSAAFDVYGNTGYGRNSAGGEVSSFFNQILDGRGCITNKLIDWVYALEPTGGDEAYEVKECILKAAGIDDDNMSIYQKVAKIKQLCTKAASENNTTYANLSDYQLFDYLLTNGFVSERTYTKESLVETYKFTEDEIEKYYYVDGKDEKGEYIYKMRRDKALEEMQMPYSSPSVLYRKYYDASFFPRDEYQKYCMENGLTAYDEKGYPIQDSAVEFITKTNQKDLWSLKILKNAGYNAEYGEFRDALFETILTNFDNFNVDNESGSLVLDQLDSEHCLTKTFFDEHAEELQRLSEKDQEALIEKCLKKLTQNSLNMVCGDWLISLVTAMGGQVTSLVDGSGGIFENGSTKLGHIKFVLNDKTYDLDFEPNDGVRQPVQITESVYDEYIQYLKKTGKSEIEINDIIKAGKLERTSENNTDDLYMPDFVTQSFVDFLADKYNLTEYEVSKMFSPTCQIKDNKTGKTEILQYGIDNKYKTLNSFNPVSSSINSLQDLIYYLEHRDDPTQVRNSIVYDENFAKAQKEVNNSLNNKGYLLDTDFPGLYTTKSYTKENDIKNPPSIYLWDDKSGKLINTGVSYKAFMETLKENPKEALKMFTDENIRGLVKYYLTLPPQGNPNTTEGTFVVDFIPNEVWIEETGEIVPETNSVPEEQEESVSLVRQEVQQEQWNNSWQEATEAVSDQNKEPESLPNVNISQNAEQNTETTSRKAHQQKTDEIPSAETGIQYESREKAISDMNLSVTHVSYVYQSNSNGTFYMWNDTTSQMVELKGVSDIYLYASTQIWINGEFNPNNEYYPDIKALDSGFSLTDKKGIYARPNGGLVRYDSDKQNFVEYLPEPDTYDYTKEEVYKNERTYSDGSSSKVLDHCEYSIVVDDETYESDSLEELLKEAGFKQTKGLYGDGDFWKVYNLNIFYKEYPTDDGSSTYKKYFYVEDEGENGGKIIELESLRYQNFEDGMLTSIFQLEGAIEPKLFVTLLSRAFGYTAYDNSEETGIYYKNGFQWQYNSQTHKFDKVADRNGNPIDPNIDYTAEGYVFESLEDAILKMGLTTSSLAVNFVYQEDFSWNEPGIQEKQFKQYIWNETTHQMIELKDVFVVGIDESTNEIYINQKKATGEEPFYADLCAVRAGYNLTETNGIYEKDGVRYRFNNGVFEKITQANESQAEKPEETLSNEKSEAPDNTENNETNSIKAEVNEETTENISASTDTENVSEAQIIDEKPEVTVIAKNYNAKREELAKKHGMIAIRENTGMYMQVQGGIRYNYVYNPQTEIFEFVSADFMTNKGELNNKNNPSAIRLHAILKAQQMELNFTSNYPFICEKDGAYYYYDIEKGEFIKH